MRALCALFYHALSVFDKSLGRGGDLPDSYHNKGIDKWKKMCYTIGVKKGTSVPIVNNKF